jgi:outer membrane protein assembly factor BamB
MKLLSWALALGVAGAVHALDWPEFRGPTGQGHSPAGRVPVRWSATENVAWQVPVPGAGWSSPVLVAGRLYLTTAVSAGDEANLSLRVLCLDATDGKVRWDTEVFTPARPGSRHGKNGFASPTPIARDGRLYVHFGHLGTACLDLAGQVLWRQADLGYSPVHGNGGSPALVGDRLFFSCDGAENPFVVALDAKSGKKLWQTVRDTPAKRKFSFSTPLAIEVDGRSQVISPGSGAVCAYDPADGRELWRARYGEGYSVITRPVFGHGLLFVSSSYDRPVVYAVRPAGAQGDVTDSHVAWTHAKGAPNTPSTILVGDELYFVSDAGIATAVEAKTGKVRWSERLGGDFSASPVFADGRLYFQNETGTGYVVKPGQTYELLAKNDLGERTLASYAVDDGALFIRGEKHLFRIGKP